MPFFTEDDDSEFGENASVREADLLKQLSAVRDTALSPSFLAHMHAHFLIDD